MKEAIAKGMKGVIETLPVEAIKQIVGNFINNNETQAELLGKFHGHCVIAHLQKETVAKNLRRKESEDEKNEEIIHKSRHSVIAQDIIEAVRQGLEENQKSKPSGSTEILSSEAVQPDDRSYSL